MGWELTTEASVKAKKARARKGEGKKKGAAVKDQGAGDKGDEVVTKEEGDEEAA